jgi:hypothetical protein
MSWRLKKRSNFVGVRGDVVVSGLRVLEMMPKVIVFRSPA